MVAVMMGRQDMGQRPAGRLQRIEDRLFLRRVDGDRGAGIPVVHQHAEIVAPAAELADLDRSHKRSSPSD